MSLVQPNIIAEALGNTSNALRKRRVSGNNKDNLDYIVTSSGRALYKYDSICIFILVSSCHTSLFIYNYTYK